MFNYRKGTTLRICILTSILVIFLSGCFGPSPEENIYSTLEKVVTLEDSFKQQQEPLLKLEKKEAELYNRIMDLGMKEFEKVVELSNEAISLVKERESKMEKEYESIQSSKEEFKNVNEEIEKIDNENVSKKVIDLKTVMENRYKSYESLYDGYKMSVSLDIELYTMLQKEDLTIEELEGQITKINDSYKKVMVQNEKFNQLTEEYNKLKMEFYKAAELDVVENKK